jgi:transcription initiation factor IIF auxiliary subunit
MAEKRAKDRVILKLVGLHGDVYSEEEADDFKDTQKKTKEHLEESVEKNYSVIEGMVRQSTDNPIEEAIPTAVKKYGGRLLSDLKEDELVELQQMVTTKKWAQRIDDALDVFRPAPIDEIAEQGADDPTAPEVVETFKQADTAWLNL